MRPAFQLQQPSHPPIHPTAHWHSLSARRNGIEPPVGELNPMHAPHHFLTYHHADRALLHGSHLRTGRIGVARSTDRPDRSRSLRSMRCGRWSVLSTPVLCDLPLRLLHFVLTITHRLLSVVYAICALDVDGNERVVTDSNHLLTSLMPLPPSVVFRTRPRPSRSRKLPSSVSFPLAVVAQSLFESAAFALRHSD